MPRILVLDANQRSALAVVRSLGRKNMHVTVADHMTGTLAGASRYARGAEQYADPARDPGGFLRDVAAIVHRLGADMVVPTTDLTSMLLVADPQSVGNAQLAAPPLDCYEQLSDKGRLVELATRQNVAVPKTWVAHTREEIQRVASELMFPLVLKPARSRYRKGDRVISTGVSIVRSEEELRAKLAGLSWLEDIPCLVQQFIPGHGAGIFALCGRGEPIAWFAHRRIREKPPSGGVSVVSESAPVEERMRAAAAALLSAAQWSGVAMVEFRVSEDGMPYLMEVNGRFWGSLQLAIDCGMDFPWLLYQLTRGGQQPQAPAGYPLGRRLRWLLGDLDNLILQIRSREMASRAKLGVVGRFLGSFADFACRQEVFRWSDPAPAARELRGWLADVAR